MESSLGKFVDAVITGFIGSWEMLDDNISSWIEVSTQLIADQDTTEFFDSWKVVASRIISFSVQHAQMDPDVLVNHHLLCCSLQKRRIGIVLKQQPIQKLKHFIIKVL